MVKYQVKKLLKDADVLTKKPIIEVGKLRRNARIKGLPKSKVAHLASTFKRTNAKARRLANRKLRSKAALAAAA